VDKVKALRARSLAPLVKARGLRDDQAQGTVTFSVERRMDFLAALGQDVEITVRPARRGQGAVSMVG